MQLVPSPIYCRIMMCVQHDSEALQFFAGTNTWNPNGEQYSYILGTIHYRIQNLDKHLQGMTVIHVLPFTKLSEVRVERDKSILSTKIQRVIDTPVDLSDKRQQSASDNYTRAYLSDLPSWVEQPL